MFNLNKTEIVAKQKGFNLLNEFVTRLTVKFRKTEYFSYFVESMTTFS